VLTDLKILEFLSSQRFHATRMTKGSKALRLILDTRFQDRSHQSTNLSSVPDANCCKPQRLRSLNHTSRLKTHHVSKWLMVPETCKHRAQDRRPTGRDGVQHRHCNTSQTKNLQVLGALVFQSSCWRQRLKTAPET
jgi:hypothetical protein